MGVFFALFLSPDIYVTPAEAGVHGCQPRSWHVEWRERPQLGWGGVERKPGQTGRKRRPRTGGLAPERSMEPKRSMGAGVAANPHCAGLLASCSLSAGRRSADPRRQARCRPWRMAAHGWTARVVCRFRLKALLRRAAFRARGCHLAFRADGFRLARPASLRCLNLLLRVGFGRLAGLVIYLKSLPFPAGLSFGHAGRLSPLGESTKRNLSGCRCG